MKAEEIRAMAAIIRDTESRGDYEVEAPVFAFVNGEKKIVGVGVISRIQREEDAYICIGFRELAEMGYKIVHVQEDDPIDRTTKHSIVLDQTPYSKIQIVNKED